MSDSIVVTDDGAVRTIRMNRPEKKNALTQPMYAAMTGAMREAEANEAIRCLVLAGGRGAFCAGADIGEFLESAQSGGLRPHTLDFLKALANNQKPLVAAVGGLAVGIGTTLLFHCDHVVAAADATFTTPFLKLALIPEAASSLLAPMRMGYARAFEMLVMGHPLSAEQAREAGIVNKVVDAAAVDAVALQAAQEIAALPAGAVAVSRRLLRGHLDAVVRQIDTEVMHFKDRLQSDEARAAFSAFLSRKSEAAMSLAGKTLFITGASRGIGLAIALRAARDGANIAIAAKTAAPHPKLQGTIYTAADEIERAGGKALPLVVDVRDEAVVRDALDQTAQKFGGIDIVVNNASAIQLTPVVDTDMRRFDLMHQINARGTFVVSKWAIPYLAKAANPHILMISPPLDMKEKWFAPHTAYSMAKFGMSLVVLGLAGELRSQGIAVNALWPRTIIATAAIQNLLGGDARMRQARKPDIMADAAHAIFASPSRELTGRFLIDDNFLAERGVTDFDRYRVDPGEPLAQDFFLPDDIPPPPGVATVETYGDRR